MLRDWLIENAVIVTRVAVGLVYVLAAAVGWVVLAGLVIAFRPEGGYTVEVWAVSLAVTYLHIRAGRPVGRHAVRATA